MSFRVSGGHRRRPTTHRLRDEATYHGTRHAVYENVKKPHVRVMFIGSNAPKSLRDAPFGSKHDLEYDGATRKGRKVTRRIGDSNVPVLEFKV